MSNRLASATSPYLTQHAENPVDWYPWGDEALGRARAEDKPLLVSIGYSACHWCHVMAHESFEDPDVAAIMNAHFVNVKVDREERPDLDQICQTAHALLTRRSGGWPLTIFFTPAGEPFFSGTYFPKHERYGLPGFIDLLPRIAAAYKAQRTAIDDQSRRLMDAMQALEPRATATPLPARAPGVALAGLKRTFDRLHGGFGGAPKFPHEAELDFCMRAWASAHDADALTIVRTTLTRMAEGGIYDQIGGGFCRYSVDAEWTIPHFEKMLYDNGPLLALYADAARATGEPGYAEIARGVAAFLEREMTAPDGALYSSLDADSEGEEGRYYVWTQEEARRAMRFDEWAVAAPYFGLDRAPNFEGRSWHLRVVLPLAQVAQRLGMSLPDAQHRLSGARAALLAQRSTRVRPARDEKILTSWNALGIIGFARASRALDEPRFADAAFAAADALMQNAWRDGKLYATRRGGRAELDAYLDDHAFVLAALLELMQTRFRAQDWTFATRIADTLLDQFEDWKSGGFWFTGHHHEKLFHRSKPGHDNATPSGNGIAAQALIAFGHLASEARYLDAAERAVRLFAPALAETPTGYSSLLTALEDLEAPPTVIVLDGERAETVEWQRSLERLYRPTVRILNIAGDNECPPELRKGRTPARGVAAWVCHGTTCRPPVGSLFEVEAMLSSRG
jgi:uncharacterized protein YyaL (SSP411 family)